MIVGGLLGAFVMVTLWDKGLIGLNAAVELAPLLSALLALMFMKLRRMAP